MGRKIELEFSVELYCPNCKTVMTERPRLKDGYKIIMCSDCGFAGGFKKPKTIEFPGLTH